MGSRNLVGSVLKIHYCTTYYYRTLFFSKLSDIISQEKCAAFGLTFLMSLIERFEFCFPKQTNVAHFMWYTQYSRLLRCHYQVISC